jgi:protein CLEC16A
MIIQDVEVSGDKDDSRSLHITIHKPSSNHVRSSPLLAARFIFDDHIRCMAAKQRLTKGRMKARQQKMNMIERLLDLPSATQSATGSSPAPVFGGGPLGTGARTGGPIPGTDRSTR